MLSLENCTLPGTAPRYTICPATPLELKTAFPNIYPDAFAESEPGGFECLNCRSIRGWCFVRNTAVALRGTVHGKQKADAASHSDPVHQQLSDLTGALTNFAARFIDNGTEPTVVVKQEALRGLHPGGQLAAGPIKREPDAGGLHPGGEPAVGGQLAAVRIKRGPTAAPDA